MSTLGGRWRGRHDNNINPPLRVAGDTSPSGGGSDFVTYDGTHIRTFVANEYKELKYRQQRNHLRQHQG